MLQTQSVTTTWQKKQKVIHMYLMWKNWDRGLLHLNPFVIRKHPTQTLIWSPLKMTILLFLILLVLFCLLSQSKIVLWIDCVSSPKRQTKQRICCHVKKRKQLPVLLILSSLVPLSMTILLCLPQEWQWKSIIVLALELLVIRLKLSAQKSLLFLLQLRHHQDYLHWFIIVLIRMTLHHHSISKRYPPSSTKEPNRIHDDGRLTLSI